MGLYEVPGMTLIAQQMRMACWYASAQMLIQWRQDKTQESLPWLVPPDLDAQCAAIRDADSGVQNSQILAMAGRLGLQSVPPSSPTPEGIESWLRTYGPLWVNGKSHITVIAGIDTDKLMVKVYDPAPVGSGKIEWRSLSTWYATGNSVASRDTGSDVDAVFLYVPLHTFTAASAPPSTATIYTVAAGDNLSKISQSVYGTPNQWNKIYLANKKVIGPNPNKLFVGQRLTIP
jgi:LysM repeat protein